ncbi:MULTISPECIES: PfkB family carbohydrate kinase [Streptomyces]|uniref:5-dehydro-2-deoxygluconokinase n=2 Tax=Streptomyces TaxID=1883 RepID=A0A3R7IAR9_9ACTN|nr:MULTISPECIES: PfkB family carbohydrate kinase [Streptomyces]KNE82507.1 5-dehydro-2-deoxygluconokinase [Streptomyces fradiae]OFA39189.1 5-dehydro-2-deoxygluconokinase [Streptomyces fradiae]PQM22946.1 5-dehydro-2-deoxygluconokinase [Streptomyces xinghaiensis]RKM97420.1 5-dehydro-2-deoxygluconokinase [Streptomyces xinghaiensis]RNC73746.1 5-dehydro-2-deoxygluconokinase [Streptomyces xinghaiensis]
MPERTQPEATGTPPGPGGTPYELITMGRTGVDLYPLQTGVGLAEVETFGKFLGGSPTNVAVAAARLGRRAAVISRTGADPFGEYIHRALREFGVDDRWVTAVPRLPTPVTFCEIFPPDHFPLYFYRQPKAPDLEITAAELDLDAIRAARVFWMTGTGLCEEPSRSATLAALAARSGAVPRPGPAGHSAGPAPHFVTPAACSAGPEAAREAAPEADRDPDRDPDPDVRPDAPSPAAGAVTVFDLDWRPMFWPAPGADPAAESPAARAARAAAARPHYARALKHATVAVGNLDECEIATGLREPKDCARALLDAGVELAVVKQGPRGVLAMHRDGTTAEVPPMPVEVVNGLGAGDAFGGSLCHGLLAGWDLERTIRHANAAAAIVASRLACSPAMPTAAEVEAALTGP